MSRPFSGGRALQIDHQNLRHGALLVRAMNKFGSSRVTVEFCTGWVTHDVVWLCWSSSKYASLTRRLLIFLLYFMPKGIEPISFG